jgi:hypothetical protein
MKDKNPQPLSPDTADWTVSRRTFLKGSGFVIAGLSIGIPIARDFGIHGQAKLAFGMVTDAHYADEEPKGSRNYRESLVKMSEFVNLMNDKEVNFIIELGDLKDQGEPGTEESTLNYLDAIEKIFGQFKGPRYHVLGNHDVDSISKEQFLSRVENTGIDKQSKYYSFDFRGVHLVVLDANYSADGSDYDRGNFDWTDTHIPLKQLNWIKKDLASSKSPVIVFVHQQLDVSGSTGVKNGTDIRQLLKDSRKVLAVFQGHQHAGYYSLIDGIHYYTLEAMVEGKGVDNNSYAIVEVFEDNSIVVTGYRKAVGREMRKA